MRDLRVVLSHPTLARLQTGRPVLLGSDAAASLRARGVDLRGPASLGRLLREHPATVRDHYRREIEAGVDVIACLTSDTLPRALQQIGMPFRAAALTGDAVELAIDVADLAARPLVVAGVLGNLDVPPLEPGRLAEELDVHAARLATAGCEVIFTRGSAALASARQTTLPTWVVASIDADGRAPDGADAVEVAQAFARDGAEMAIFEIAEAAEGHALLELLRKAPEAGPSEHVVQVGFALAAGARSTSEWAREAAELAGAGAKALGGGHGATAAHVAELAMLLGGTSAKRQSIWPRAV